jgi:MATE family multidrug resistance protein
VLTIILKNLYMFTKIFTEFKVSMRLSVPLIISEVIFGLNGFISSIMVAHLGEEALAANALVWSIFIALILFFIGILTAVSIMVAHSFGAQDQNGIKNIVKQGLILGALFTVPMMIIVYFAPALLSLTGQDSAIMQLATPYLHSLLWCMLPLNTYIVLEQFLIGIGLTRLTMIFNVVSVPMHLACYYALLFGKFGLPKLGLPGIGYSFAFVFFILTIFLWLYVQFADKCRHYKIFSANWRIQSKYCLELLRVGMPLGGTFCVEVGLFATLAIMMGRLGSSVLAAHQITYQCFIFALTFIFGLAQGVSIRVGHEVGRNDREALKLAVWVNMGIGFITMLLFSIVYLSFPRAVIGLFVDVNAIKLHNIVHYTMLFLAIAAVLQLTECFRMLDSSALRGLKDTKTPMYISVVSFWLIAFPLAYLLGFRFHFGGQGIWWSLVIGLMIAAMTLFVRFYRLVQKVDLVALVTK